MLKQKDPYIESAYEQLQVVCQDQKNGWNMKPGNGAVQRVWDAVLTSRNGLLEVTQEVRFEYL